MLSVLIIKNKKRFNNLQKQVTCSIRTQIFMKINKCLKLNLNYVYAYWPFFEAYTWAANVTPCAHGPSSAAMVRRGGAGESGAGGSSFEFYVRREVNLGGCSRGRTLGRVSPGREFHFEGGVFGCVVRFSLAAVAGHRERLISVARAGASDDGGGGRRASRASAALRSCTRPRRTFDSTRWRRLYRLPSNVQWWSSRWEMIGIT